MNTDHPENPRDQRLTEAFRALIRTCGLLGRVMHPYFQQFGISGAQFGILRTLQLAEQEGHTGLRLTQLGERMLVRPPSVTGVVDRLLRAGLVVRQVSAQDLRAKEVSLTPAGRHLLQRVLEGHPAQVESILEPLDGEGRDELHRLLRRLNAHLESKLTGSETPVTVE